MATNETEETKKKSILMVAAIDFGTTYSGFAYSCIKGKHEDEKLRICANQTWNSGGRQFMSQKTPTCVLLNKDKKLESFGFDAENQYADIVIDGEADDYYFFDRFKMILYTREDISIYMEISDVRGKSLPAIKVFSAAIKALRQSLMNQVEKQGIHLHPDEIKWILTVPAMWTDKAKEFMRKSAEKAKIRKDRLLIALEPEAASIYCQHLPPDELTGAPEGFSISDNDTKYLVVDIGGGTVDITAHHKVGEDDLQELCSASGGFCGGTTVDKEFLSLYETIVGERVMEALPKDYTVSYLDLLREFETVKRTIRQSKRAMINLTIPISHLDVLCLRFLEKDFTTAIRDSEYHDKISIAGDKMRMNKELMQSLFETTKVNIIREIRNVLERVPTTNLKTVLLVGGFSECIIIQDAIKLAFPDKQILIPQMDAGLVVVKGAVLFGRKPDFITSRITQYTYGRRIRPIFDESNHDPQKRVKGENADRCRDVFEAFMEKNNLIPVDTIVKLEYHTVMNYQSTVSVAIYFTKKDSANYVTDRGCEKLFEFPVEIPEPSEERRHVDVEFRFGSTELQVTATERKTQHKTSMEYNFIM